MYVVVCMCIIIFICVSLGLGYIIFCKGTTLVEFLLVMYTTGAVAKCRALLLHALSG